MKSHFLLFICALVLGPFAMGAMDPIFRTLQESALSFGNSDLAEAAVAYGEYHSKLGLCDASKKTQSSVHLRKFMEDFSRKLNGYLVNSSYRRPFRNEVQEYVTNAAALLRYYLEDKGKRFGQGSKSSVMPQDSHVYALTGWLPSRTAQILVVGNSDIDSVEAYWRKMDLARMEGDPRWANIARAIQELQKFDEAPCNAK